MKICYVLSYRTPEYIRTHSLLAALREIPGLELFEAINENTGPYRYIETFLKIRQIKEQVTPDVYLLGFRGHEIYWPLRWLIGNKPIIFDALMSPYASLKKEKKHGKLGAAAGTIWRPIEQKILNNANLLLTDTMAHCKFFENEFSLPKGKIIPVPVGAVEQNNHLFDKNLNATTNTISKMSVLFYGSFLPLHGIDVILKAAHILKNYPIRFDFIGGNSKQIQNLITRCAELKITQYTHRKWLSFDELVSIEIPKADICLGGPFGNTDQARRVVTSKTSQSLALGKPTVIGQIAEAVEFIDKKNCLLVPQGDHKALAKTIQWAFDNKEKLSNIGKNGQKLYTDKLSIDIIRKILNKALANLHQ